ncbi:hypothetical protein E1B28_002992 [Marasmius oreades]|uniref:Uncharacterized protein n=1 Tax=Marasmius oreades TaxID=181124 RepID=A0A9P7RLH3_9AGAR|nr:uncharacterized protein E1B28_002992 [Marasmius oreades]KAG7085431.1 hypothetical protein E1B28_002992 [Marasmius oreades]
MVGKYLPTVIKFIKTEYTLPTDQLRIILDIISNQSSVSATRSPLNDLDELYLMVLRANPDRDKRLLPILAIIVLNLPNGKSPAFIELVLGHSPGTVAQTLRAMHSVLEVRDRKDEIRIYHKSFMDFLHDQARSKEFFIDKPMWKDRLASDSLFLQKLVKDWKHVCLRRVSHKRRKRRSNVLWLEVDAFYHMVLSISAELVGHDMLLHILAAILLFPSGESRSPEFIQLLLGLRREVLDQALQTFKFILQRQLYASSLSVPGTLSTFLLHRKQ